MALINDTATLKLFVPLETSIRPPTFKSDVERAEQDYILKAIGQAVYDLIAGATPTADQLVLLKKVRTALAPLACFYMLPKINVRIGDGGIVTSQSESTERAAKWQFDDAHTQFLMDGYNALEKLFEFMEGATTADWYPTWSASAAFTTYKKYFVNRAAIMQDSGVNIKGSRWLFSQMLPSLTNVEQLFAAPFIGEDFFNALKAKFKAGTLSTEEKVVVEKLQQGISLMAYAKALKQPDFINELVVVSATRSDDIKDPIEAFKQYQPLSCEYENMAQSVMNGLIIYLNKNASLVLFATYYTSDLYVDPLAEEPKLNIDKRTRNSESNGTFFM